jgi:beta-glucosidase
VAPDLKFAPSVGSASVIEGARSEGGKGDSIWDVFSENKDNIMDNSNGDVAVDHYHRFKEDIELMAKLGFGAYRFSISWARIFPDGLGTEINKEGVAFSRRHPHFLCSSLPVASPLQSLRQKSGSTYFFPKPHLM